MTVKKNVIVRRAEPEDVEGIYNIYQGDNAVFGTLQLPYQSLENNRKRSQEMDPQIFHLVAIIENELSGHIILNPYLKRIRRRHCGSLGMAVRDDAQGKGVGSALMQAAIDLADNWLNLRRLELNVYTDNDAAIHLYKKFGFIIEGRNVDYAFRNGEYVDSYMMARIKQTISAESDSKSND